LENSEHCCSDEWDNLHANQYAQFGHLIQQVHCTDMEQFTFKFIWPHQMAPIQTAPFRWRHTPLFNKELPSRFTLTSSFKASDPCCDALLPWPVKDDVSFNRIRISCSKSRDAIPMSRRSMPLPLHCAFEMILSLLQSSEKKSPVPLIFAKPFSSKKNFY
jgi:hypothetical protein